MGLQNTQIVHSELQRMTLLCVLIGCVTMTLPVRALVGRSVGLSLFPERAKLYFHAPI